MRKYLGAVSCWSCPCSWMLRQNAVGCLFREWGRSRPIARKQFEQSSRAGRCSYHIALVALYSSWVPIVGCPASLSTDEDRHTLWIFAGRLTDRHGGPAVIRSQRPFFAMSRRKEYELWPKKFGSLFNLIQSRCTPLLFLRRPYPAMFGYVLHWKSAIPLLWLPSIFCVVAD